MNCKLIAFDLDGTLLMDDKTLSEENKIALLEAYDRGIVLVPTTGRTFSVIPACVRDLDLYDWAVVANGAAVYNVRQDRIVHSDYIPLAKVMPLLDFLDTIDCKYDGFQNNTPYMNADMLDTIADYTGVPEILQLLTTTRTPVKNLRETLIANASDVQKVTVHFKNQTLRHQMLRELPERYPEFTVTTSIPNNIEINNLTACKGNALSILGNDLGISLSEMVAFGDGTNDVSMLRTAGLGVAMKNAAQEALEAADYVTDTNNNAGVAQAILRILRGDF